jgi:hypothetical protein
MKARWLVCMLAVFLMGRAAAVVADDGDRIVTVRSGLNGVSVINAVCNLFDCTVVRSLDTVPGESQPSSIFLVRGLTTTVVTTLLSLLGVASIEVDLPVAMSDAWQASQATAAVLDELWDQRPATYYGTTAWISYLHQPATNVVRLRDTHCGLRQTGAGIVAVIDTGADLGHPTLAPIFASGYDFTRNAAGGDEMADVDPSSPPPDGIFWVRPSSAAALNQATAAVLDDPERAAFGHGTMVAGVIHLVAPTAQIMPLKAFRANGEAHTSDILRAIYYATHKGAKVLNMSFSRPTSSLALRLALEFATVRGLVPVASAGNDGLAVLRYPAAYSNVIGVASTSNEDVRSSFSNYGSNLVWLAAPGEGIITTFPWGSFAATSGTSFSTPFVSGAAALLAGMNASADQGEVAAIVAQAHPLSSELGHGRLDAYRATDHARGLWPGAPSSPVPDTCESEGVDWIELP